MGKITRPPVEKIAKKSPLTHHNEKVITTPPSMIFRTNILKLNSAEHTFPTVWLSISTLNSVSILFFNIVEFKFCGIVLNTVVYLSSLQLP